MSIIGGSARLRQIIDGLSLPQIYALLKKVPKFYEFIPIVKNTNMKKLLVKIPKELAKLPNGYSVFGIYVEQAIQLMFNKYVECNYNTSNTSNSISHGKWKSSKRTGRTIVEGFRGYPFPLIDHQKILLPIKKFVKKTLCRNMKIHSAEFNTEYVQFDPSNASNTPKSTMEAHPDIIIRDSKNNIIVCEIKTTHRWDIMAVQSLLQVLCYSAILIYNGTPVEEFCLILPLQRKTLKGCLHGLKKDDVSEFIVGLFEIKKARERDRQMQMMAMLQPRLDLSDVGSHIQKINGKIYDSIVDIYERYRRPYSVASQIFLASPRGFSKTVLAAKDIEQSKNYIVKNGIHMYVHAPYYINLCKPRNARSKAFGEEGSWSLDKLITELKYAHEMHMKGVVVHTGKYLDIPLKKAYSILVESLCTVLSEAPEGRLLFETGAGQGTEMCIKQEELIELYKTITIEKGYKNFSICLDTCHVFAAGYDPNTYLKSLLDADVDIRLIHFNGSKSDKGSCADRHMFANHPLQKIPIEQLQEVLDICRKRHIDMVVE